MSFEHATRNATAMQRRVIVADPATLRELANRMETAAMAAREGESVLCELSPGITVVFKPEARLRAPGDAAMKEPSHESQK